MPKLYDWMDRCKGHLPVSAIRVTIMNSCMDGMESLKVMWMV